MFNLFKKEEKQNSDEITNFDYLDSKAYYFDTACQTLRPQEVIEAESDYYHNFNSCGHRVKYKWGEITDLHVNECRENLLKLVGKSTKDYTVAFCLNTTHGINTILMQLDEKKLGLERVVTSEIEHNSVFLPTIAFSKKTGLPRVVLQRSADKSDFGSLIYTQKDLKKAVVILNSTSNIDGQNLQNIAEIEKDVHKNGGILLLDACQTLAHHPETLEKIDFDAAFGSGHKMYGQSVGFIIIKKSLVKTLDCYLIGGSTVEDVQLNSYSLISDETELYSRIEPGLQNYAGIIGLNEAIKWRKNWKASNQTLVEKNDLPANLDLNASKYEELLAIYLHQKLKEFKSVKILNPNPSPIVSLYTDKIDGHKLAMYLSEAGIMCRSGYHCCHYYLKNKLKLPPLFRISLGLNNTPEQIDYLIEKMRILVT